MYFEQFHLRCLSQASYMIGSGGVAAVVDPRRDVSTYMREACRNGLRIGYVILTHLDAELVSGHHELAQVTGASVYAGARSRARFRHVPLREHDEIRFGNCRLEFLETPGHTPESISILVTDLERSAEPFAVLTGDTLLAGEVGRPPLSFERSPQELAAELYGSLLKFSGLGDEVEVCPAHGAGPRQGRSTMGRERASNYALRARSRAAFVKLLTTGLPDEPGCAALDGGAAPWGPRLPLAALEAGEAAARQRAGAVVVDTRPAVQFEGAHIAGSLHLGLAGPFAAWARALVEAGRDVLLVSEDPAALDEARARLACAGVGPVTGYLEDSLVGWDARGLPLGSVRRIEPAELASELAEWQILDVRQPEEWSEGRIREARLCPLDRLRETVAQVARPGPLAIYCDNGYRSAIAASLLEAQGFGEVADMSGGFEAWKALGLPVSR